MKVLGLTISREGSKRLPGKNMKLMCGKPLLEWTLLSLKNSKHIMGHYLVTDSEAQAKLAESHGFTVVWQETAEIDMAEANDNLLVDGGDLFVRTDLLGDHSDILIEDEN